MGIGVAIFHLSKLWSYTNNVFRRLPLSSSPPATYIFPSVMVAEISKMDLGMLVPLVQSTTRLEFAPTGYKAGHKITLTKKE
jgi:hypothetical protein